jgi:hypothetical protein
VANIKTVFLAKTYLGSKMEVEFIIFNLKYFQKNETDSFKICRPSIISGGVKDGQGSIGV